MSNHAPGPWSFDPGFSGKSAFVVDVEGHMIAMLPHADPKGLDNAKLIALGPEMLAALRLAYEYFTDSYSALRFEKAQTAIVDVLAKVDHV